VAEALVGCQTNGAIRDGLLDKVRQRTVGALVLLALAVIFLYVVNA
jgi:hypothetical protein